MEQSREPVLRYGGGARHFLLAKHGKVFSPARHRYEGRQGYDSQAEQVGSILEFYHQLLKQMGSLNQVGSRNLLLEFYFSEKSF